MLFPKQYLLQFLRIRSLKFHFNQSVLLRPNSFAARSIVVHAGLPRHRRVDRVTLPIFDSALFLQTDELPSHEAVVIGVGISRDERPPPVNLWRVKVGHFRALNSPYNFTIIITQNLLINEGGITSHLRQLTWKPILFTSSIPRGGKYSSQ